jgi:hypothetical protein
MDALFADTDDDAQHHVDQANSLMTIILNIAHCDDNHAALCADPAVPNLLARSIDRTVCAPQCAIFPLR